ncbi:15355_t:CDS:2, partial [Racocetra persica]
SYNIPSTNLEEIGSSSWAAKLEDLKRKTQRRYSSPIRRIVSTRVSVLVSRIERLKTNKGLDERLGVLIVEKETMTLEQIIEVQEMVDETIRDHSLYDPQALEYFFKILTDVSQDNNPDVFDAYYDESAEEPLESIAFSSKEEERETELEVLLQKLITESEEKNNDLPDDRIKVARIGGAKEIYPVGPYCEEDGVKEVKEKKEIEVEKEEARVEKNKEKEVEVKREEKEETKEEKREKYEENIPARIGKILGETEDEDDDNEADEDEEDNDDNDETIVDKEDNEKKEDVKELTKKSKDLDYACESWIKKVERFRKDGDSKEQFDPGGFDQSRIIVEKDLEKANENPDVRHCPGQVVKEKEGTRLKRLRNSQCISRNPTKGLALYLPQWNETRVYDPGGKQR